MATGWGAQRRAAVVTDVSEYQEPRTHQLEIVRRTQPPKPAPGRYNAVAPWVESLLCFVAVIGLGLSLRADFQNVRTAEYVATDYKTVYASADLFRRGGNPFSIAEIVDEYKKSGVVLPKNMFGHMPVYPPVTLLALWPLTYMSMGQSSVVWLFASMCAVAAAASMLLSEARAQGLHWGFRMLLLAFAIGTPMLGYALDIGNVSPAVAALATVSLLIAIRESRRQAPARRWQNVAVGAISLGAALCLKPHLAIWILVGIALVCERPGRLMAAIAGGLFVLGNAGSALVLWNRGAVREVLDSFLAMLKSERGSGSMAPASREILHVKSQITGLDSLLGLWVQPPWRDAIITAALTGLFAILLIAAKRNRSSRDRNWQILFVLAVFGVGMLVSYHRAHDAVILPGLLGLWLCQVIRPAMARRMSKATRWIYGTGSAAIVVLLVGSWFSIPAEAAFSIAAWLHAPALGDLLTLR
ncbi:MAG TPA: glycosyltransferase family 87 protein, partial [Acidobacteriaceae bacterium]|nr:glycosyltransferase family 87 protein [Acidobacteriaceae bacterium]